MKKVIVTTISTDSCGGPTICSITAVSSNEPEAVNGNDPSPDWHIIVQKRVMLRAQRLGEGNGRIYHITVTCKGWVQIEKWLVVPSK